MKKLLTVVMFAFAFNAFAGTFAEETKTADKAPAAKKDEKKDEKKKEDTSTNTKKDETKKDEKKDEHKM